jgi:FkbM family methyltransferase
MNTSRLRHRLHAALPESLARRLRLALAATRIAADRESARRIRELGRDRIHADASEETVSVRVKQLGGGALVVRPRTADVDTLWGTFMRPYHLPPAAVGAGAQRIWDLGCNAGFTMAHLASSFPQASITGVELDESNALLARRNVERWGDRCEVIHAAVWPDDGEVWYHRWAGATSGYRVAVSERQATVEGPVVPALSLNSLAGRTDEPIDYVKMDVEGAERELLEHHTEWAERVRAIKVEVHAPYTLESCIDDLRALGFEARPDGGHPSCAVGIRAA